MYQAASCGNGLLGNNFLVTYNNLFNYGTIKQTKLIKKWDAGPVVQVHISHEHHLWQVSPACFNRGTLNWFRAKVSLNRLPVYTRNPAASSPKDPTCSAVWGNARNTQSLYLSFYSSKRNFRHLPSWKLEWQIQRKAAIYSESTLLHFTYINGHSSLFLVHGLIHQRLQSICYRAHINFFVLEMLF